MTRVERLLGSPRALHYLLTLVCEELPAVTETLTPAERLGKTDGLIRDELLADPVALAGIAVSALDSWRWRTGIDQVALLDLSAALRPAAEQLAAAPATAEWWRPLDRHRQTWLHAPGEPPQPDLVYFDPDEFSNWVTRPSTALWTSTGIGDLSAAGLLSDFDGTLRPPLQVWRLPVRPDARVYEIATADDWQHLCAEYPKDTTRTYGRYFAEWGAPGRRVTTPDWAAVAADWEGVHVSMAGLLLAESAPLPVGDDAGTLLEGWGCEYALWFRWTFDTPTRLPDWVAPIPAE
jgi:hypothetical protein